MYQYIIVFFTAIVISLIMTPFAKKLAYKIGAIDIPKDNRRVHNKPIPRLGGVAIYIGVIISILLIVPIDKKILGMLVGSTLIMLLGIVDDIKHLSAKTKLIAQILCACILIYSGIKINFINMPFIDDKLISFGNEVSIIITIIWIVGITNTINLIDGLDGLAAGVTTIASFSLAYVAYINHSYTASLMILAIAGGCLGFLPYNFNPAKIFMGDAGSLFLGYMLAAISVEGVLKGATALATVVPVLALGLPIFDTLFAILRRALKGRPIMEADKGHLHHRILSTGIGQKKTVISLYLLSTVLGIGAILLNQSKLLDAFTLVTVAIVLLYILLAIRSDSKQNEK